MDFNEALKTLQAAGLRLTAPRRAILAALLEAGAPVSAEDLHARTTAAGLASDLSTVYRNLSAFVEAGLLDALPGASGERRYAVRGADPLGVRLMCLDCGKVLSLPDSDFKKVGRAAARQGFDPLTITVAAHCSHLCEAD
jgi:Fur family peroxide stress response transcriptional regulator